MLTLIYVYLLSLFVCLLTTLLAYISKNKFLENIRVAKFNGWALLLDKVFFIDNIYKDAKEGGNKGLTKCIVQSFIPSINSCIALAITTGFLLVTIGLTSMFIYDKAVNTVSNLLKRN